MPKCSGVLRSPSMCSYPVIAVVLCVRFDSSYLLRRLRVFTFAPLWISNLTGLKLPSSDAKCNGVERLLPWTITSASWSMNNSTTSKPLLLKERWIGVDCFREALQDAMRTAPGYSEYSHPCRAALAFFNQSSLCDARDNAVEPKSKKVM